MRLEGFTSQVTNANSANYLTGFTTIVGEKFKSPRVKSDESGFELTRKAQINIVDDGSYTLGASDNDVDGVVVLTNGANVNVSGDLVEGTQYAAVSLAGSMTITPINGASLLLPDGFDAATRDANSFVQIKNIGGASFLVFGDLLPS